MSVVETLLDAVEDSVDSLSSTEPTADRALRYRAHAALRARHGLRYADRGPVRHSAEDLLRADLDQLVGVDPSDGLPGRLSEEPLSESEVEDLAAWTRERVETVEEEVRRGAARGAALDALVGSTEESSGLCPLCEAPVLDPESDSPPTCTRGHRLDGVETVEGGLP